ncbi:MAG: phytanoyl-CoA dioxygenase family protein [Alphaproteobacteria bacterium]
MLATAERAALVTADDIAAFERDGVVCIRNLIGADWVARLRQAVERNMKSPGPWHRGITKSGAPGNFYYDSMMWRFDADFRDYVLSSPAAQVAGTLMRSKAVRFFYDQLFIKEPGTLDPMPWHHDLPYWPFRGSQVCSIWLAVEDVDRDSSGVEFVAGSHLSGKWFRPILPYNDNAKFDNLALEECPDYSTRRDDPNVHLLSWDMRAGDALVFNALTVHGSGGNTRMKHRRTGLATRWLGDDTVWDPRPATATYYYEPDGPGLQPGEKIGGPHFPELWRRGD